MYFQGELYDPLTGEWTEFDNYSQFIAKIQDAGYLQFERDAPAKEEDTYLWIKILLANSREELDKTKVPYLRLNKILFAGPYVEGKHADNPGKLFPAAKYKSTDLNIWYPNRHTGALYVTAVAQLVFSDDNKELADDEVYFDRVSVTQFYEFQEEDTQYLKDEKFDCMLLAEEFMNSLLMLQQLLDDDAPTELISSTIYKKALTATCFLTAEAARFNLVQFAVMNILNLYNDTSWSHSELYTSWSKWKPVILEWSSICDHLDKAGKRWLNPELFLGIPVNINIKRKSIGNESSLVNVFNFFSKPNTKTHLELLQAEVMRDFLNNYPFDYCSERGIFPFENEHEKTQCINKVFGQERVIDDLVKIGDLHANKSDYNSALDSYLGAFNLCHEARGEVNIQQRLTVNFKVGLTYYKLNDFENAVPYLDAADFFSTEIYGEQDARSVKLRTILEASRQQCSFNCTL